MSSTVSRTSIVQLSPFFFCNVTPTVSSLYGSTARILFGSISMQRPVAWVSCNRLDIRILFDQWPKLVAESRSNLVKYRDALLWSWRWPFLAIILDLFDRAVSAIEQNLGRHDPHPIILAVTHRLDQSVDGFRP